MSPGIATFLTFALIYALFVHASRKQGEVSRALWLPVLWLAIAGSRFLSQWIDIVSGGIGRSEEGTWVDVVFFLTLITTGLYVLVQRRVAIGRLARQNPWLTAFFIYGFLAILWSDFPSISFKRWVKTLGHPVMAIVILSDPNPANALRIVMKRCAYLLVPLSVLLIKYYPEYGRGFSYWTGEAYNQGVTTQKNSLGYLCMMFFLFFVWNLMTTRSIEQSRFRREERLLTFGFLCMIGWLLYLANSATSLFTLFVGLAAMGLVGLGIVNKRFIAAYVSVAVVVAMGAQWAFDVHAKVVELLGRDPTLTDRTLIWADCMALVDDPVFGAGFESFWLGPRLDVLWAKWPWKPNQAHSGYVETYLDLGGIGVLLLLAVIVSTFRKISAGILRDFDFSCLRLGFLVAIVFYNYTEATFKAVHPLWMVFYVIALDYPKHPQRRSAYGSQIVDASKATDRKGSVTGPTKDR